MCGRGRRRTLFAALTCFLHFIDLSSCLQVHLDNQLIDCRTVVSHNKGLLWKGGLLILTEVSNLIYGIELRARTYLKCHPLFAYLLVPRHHLVMPSNWFREAPQSPEHVFWAKTGI